MKQVISARDIQERLRLGEPLTFPDNALITPAARDLIRAHELNGGAKRNTPSPPPAPGRPSSNGAQITGATPARATRVVRPGKKAAGSSLEALFNSPEVEEYKKQICDIGRRLWQRQYVDGNGGNISMRIAENVVLCTPTLISKGFMTPEDLCLVDLDGNQLFGKRKRTSEILMHLEIMKAQPKALSCVHAHPAYATGFAVAGVSPPNNMVPELEVFVGEVPVAPYDTPGTTQVASHVAALAGSHNTILMANHGVVCWGSSVEDAYFKMEIIETYCRTVMVSSQLGKPPNTFNQSQLHQLLQLKEGLGIPDRRIGLKECELKDTDDWRPGVVCQPPPPPTPQLGTDPEAEAVVQQITDLIMERLNH